MKPTIRLSFASSLQSIELYSYASMTSARSGFFQGSEKSEALAGVDGLRLIAYDEADTPNYQYVVIELESPVAGGRDAMVAALHAENILARKYFWPGCHRMKPYRDLYPHASLLLPSTIKVANQAVVLPTGITLTAEDIETVARIVALLAMFILVWLG